MSNKKQKNDPFWKIALLLYSVIMLFLLFGRANGWVDGKSYRELLLSNMNIVPFYTIDNYLNVIFHYPQSKYFSHCIVNMVGNIVLFLPFGWLIPMSFSRLRRFFPYIATCIVSICAVEFVQLLTLLGSFDVDDIILNIAGMVTGYLVYLCFRKK